MTQALEVIPFHETWDVIDPSKLSTYMECPRKYFYQYILGWRSALPNNHLVFGTCWHLATEHLSRQGYTEESLEDAKRIFMTRYRQDFDPRSDAEMGAKHPDIALNALRDYFYKFRSDYHKYNVLHTEISAVVLISATAEMVCKLDWVGQEKDTGKYLFIDQKTSQRRYEDWGDHWQLSTQMLTYRHVLHCMFGDNLAPSKVRCAFFYKSKPGEYNKHPVVLEEAEISKTHEQMDAFLTRTNVWYQNLQHDMFLLEEEDIDNRIMLAFAQNEKACFNYGRACEYFQLCNHWGNPVHYVDRMPYGMQQSFWDPREHELVREKINLTGASDHVL